MSAREDLDARLRRIVTEHVVVGGYPDTLGIARAAYRLAREDMARDGVMHMERTVWCAGAPAVQRVDMETWLESARPSDVEALLDERMRITDDGAQAALEAVWRECDTGTAHDVDATYHWGDADRTALRRALARLRPAMVEAHEDQGSLL